MVLTYNDIHHLKISPVAGSINVRVAWNECKSCCWNTVAFSRFQYVDNSVIVTSSITSGVRHCDVSLTDSAHYIYIYIYCSDAVSKDAFMITMALLTKTIQHDGSPSLILSKYVASYSLYIHAFSRCIMVNSHINKILWHSREINSIANAQDTIDYIEFKNCILKISVTSPRGQSNNNDIYAWFS